MLKLVRIDENWVQIENNYSVDATILANEHVLIDKSTYQEIEDFLSLSNSLKELDSSIELEKVVFSPDIHKGSGIPVGTTAKFKGCVIPKAIGTDIGCGMQFTTVEISPLVIQSKELDSYLRYRFFEGGRNIALSRLDRIQIFQSGFFSTPYVPEEFLRSSTKSDTELTRDDQLGSVGGGNHFVEIQKISEVLDSEKAYVLGLQKNTICIMTHTGSVSIGQYIGKKWQDKAKDAWPTKIKKPLGGFHVLYNPDLIEQYYRELYAAANFASANRRALTKMVIESIKDLVDTEINYTILHDSFHNIATKGGLHRKGSCSAKDGELVIVPGSMGDYSYILCGHGNEQALCSACHGAGRKTNRQGSKKYESEIDNIRLVTKLDLNKSYFRKDILTNYRRSLAEEAPSCYKDVSPAINTCHDAHVASPVVQLKPILTIKGY